MTVAQLKEKEKDYGWKLSKRVNSLWDKDQTEEWIDIIHVIEPNDGREVGKIDGKNKLYRSVYFETGNVDGEIMSSSGFDECPSMVTRWETIGEDVYGSEYPGILSLGDVKELQFKVKTKAQGLALMVKPSFVGPPNVAGKKVNATPGSYTESSESESQGKIRPLFEVNLPLQALQLDIQETENIISKFYYEDMFLMLANTDRRQITAREVAERHEEKLLMLGPLLVRLHDELLSPLIDRTFGIMARGGLLPPAPKELQGQDLKVEFISLLAQAQKSVGASAIDEMTAYIGNIAQLDPSAINKLDINQAIDARADMLGVPPKMIRDTKASMAITQQRADMQAQAQQMQQMQQMATMAKDAGAASDTRLPEMVKNIVGNQ